MEEREREHVKRLEYYQRIVGETIDVNRYPWFRMVMEKHLSEEDVNEVFDLFRALEKEKEDMREAGLLDLTPLLLHYVGMLNSELDPLMTVIALQHQGHFQELAEDLIDLMQRYQ